MSEDATLDEFIKSDNTETDKMEGEGLREEGFLTLPYDWDISTVDEVVKEGGLVDGDWIESADMDEDGGIQLIQLAHIGEGQFKGEPDRFITEKFAEEENCTILSEGDLLISRMQEPILRACLLPSFEQDSVMAVDIARLQETKEWNRHFLKYLFNSQPIWKQGIAWASGTTRKRISRKNMEKLRLPSPSLKEQRKIATVLHNVDQTIQKTEETIEQIQVVKEGVRQDCIPSGVGEHNYTSIRVGPKEVNIPNSWEYKSLSDVCEKVTDGTHETPEVLDEGYPLITSEDTVEGEIDFSSNKYISEEDHRKVMRRSKPEKGDILFTHIGKNTGKVANVDVGFEFSIKNVALFKPDPSQIDSSYLEVYLRSRVARNFVARQLQGGAQDFLSLTELKKMPVLLPPEDEQVEIAEIMSSIKSLEDNEKATKSRLSRLKRGLMQDLLSGTVRTTDTNIEVPDKITQHG